MSFIRESIRNDLDQLRINLEVVTKLVYKMGKVLETNLEIIKRIEEKMDKLEKG